MSATPPATDAQAATGGQPQAGSTPNGTPTPSDTPQAGKSDGLESLTPSELASMIKELRKEAGNYRTKLTAIEKAEQVRKDAELTELERLKKQLEEKDGQLTQAQQRERRYALRDAIEEAATGERLTLTAPLRTVLRLIDEDAIEWADDGTPKNARQLLKGLAQSDPYLFAARRGPSADGGAGGGQIGTSINDQIRQKAGR